MDERSEEMDLKYLKQAYRKAKLKVFYFKEEEEMKGRV